VNHQPEANPAQTLPGKATKVMGGKKAKAADVQKQMESWMKQNNKKKEKPMSKEEADALRYEQFPNFEKSPKMTTRGQKICFRARFKIITLKSPQNLEH